MGELNVREVVGRKVEEALEEGDPTSRRIASEIASSGVLDVDAIGFSDELFIVEEGMSLVESETDKQFTDAARSTREPGFAPRDNETPAAQAARSRRLAGTEAVQKAIRQMGGGVEVPQEVMTPRIPFSAP